MSDNEIEVTEGSVYHSLHDVKTAEDMAVKAELVRQIIAIKDSRKLNQTELGELIGMNQADVSRMLRGQFRNLAVSKIMHCLTSLNQDVRIIVQRHPIDNEVGTIQVMATA